MSTFLQLPDISMRNLTRACSKLQTAIIIIPCGTVTGNRGNVAGACLLNVYIQQLDLLFQPLHLLGVLFPRAEAAGTREQGNRESTQ